LNYNLAVLRDQAIYAGARQATEANTQVGGLRREIQVAPQQPVLTRPLPQDTGTPLKRQVAEQEAQAEQKTDQSQTLVLQEMLKELKAIRERLPSVPEKAPQD
jgi:hypothetical protein